MRSLVVMAVHSQSFQMQRMDTRMDTVMGRSLRAATEDGAPAMARAIGGGKVAESTGYARGEVRRYVGGGGGGG